MSPSIDSGEMMFPARKASIAVVPFGGSEKYSRIDVLESGHQVHLFEGLFTAKNT